MLPRTLLVVGVIVVLIMGAMPASAGHFGGPDGCFAASSPNSYGPQAHEHSSSKTRHVGHDSDASPQHDRHAGPDPTDMDAGGDCMSGLTGCSIAAFGLTGEPVAPCHRKAGSLSLHAAVQTVTGLAAAPALEPPRRPS